MERTGRKTLRRNEITNISVEVWITTGVQANEIEIWWEKNVDGSKSWSMNENCEKQQIVVLKMRGECKKISFWLFIAHAPQTHIYIAHTWIVWWEKSERFYRFSQFVFHFRAAPHKRVVIVYLIRVRGVSLKTLIRWLPARAIQVVFALSFLKVL